MVAPAAGARADFKCVHLKKKKEVIYTSSLKCIQPGIIWSFFFFFVCVCVISVASSPTSFSCFLPLTFQCVLTWKKKKLFSLSEC